MYLGLFISVCRCVIRHKPVSDFILLIHLMTVFYTATFIILRHKFIFNLLPHFSSQDIVLQEDFPNPSAVRARQTSNEWRLFLNWRSHFYVRTFLFAFIIRNIDWKLIPKKCKRFFREIIYE